jgi:hypothetical protein
METTTPFNLYGLANGDPSDNYNDNLCVFCTNEYESRTIDNFGVSTIDCSKTMFVATDANSHDINVEYERSNSKNLNAEDWFKNDKPNECPVKTCKLYEKGCTTELDNENFAITGENVIVA